LDIFINESPELDGPNAMGRPNIKVTELEQSSDFGNRIPLTTEHDSLYRFSHAIVILPLGIRPRYFGSQAVITTKAVR
jgi:hypothetical protein